MLAHEHEESAQFLRLAVFDLDPPVDQAQAIWHRWASQARTPPMWLIAAQGRRRRFQPGGLGQLSVPPFSQAMLVRDDPRPCPILPPPMIDSRRELLKAIAVSPFAVRQPLVAQPRDLLAGFATHHIETSGATVHVRTAGVGPPLLLLHGFPQTNVVWHKITRVSAAGGIPQPAR